MPLQNDFAVHAADDRQASQSELGKGKFQVVLQLYEELPVYQPSV